MKNKSIAMLAIVMMAIVGVVSVPCNVSAEVSYSVLIEVDGVTYSQTVTDAEDYSYTLPTLEELNASVDGKSLKGWTVGDSETVYAPGTAVIVSENEGATIASIKAVLVDTVVTYTATFVVDDAQTQSTTVPADPIKDGYIFAGWSIDGKTIADIKAGDILELTANVTYTAIWISPTITFVVDGVIIGEISYTDLGTSMPSNPIKESYTFVGWSDGTATYTADEIVTIAVSGDTTFTAVFEPYIYIVTFVVEGETVMMQSVKFGEMATEPKLIPTKDGYDFGGWDFDFSVPIASDTVINATWVDAEPTGLSDPVMQTMVMIIILLVIVVIAVFIWARKKGKIVVSLGKKAKAEKVQGTKTVEAEKSTSVEERKK